MTVTVDDDALLKGLNDKIIDYDPDADLAQVEKAFFFSPFTFIILASYLLFVERNE